MGRKTKTFVRLASDTYDWFSVVLFTSILLLNSGVSGPGLLPEFVIEMQLNNLDVYRLFGAANNGENSHGIS